MNNFTKNNLILDSNIVIFYLKGDSRSKEIIDSNFPYVSVLSEIEVLGYKTSKLEEDAMLNFFKSVKVLELTTEIKKKSIYLKKTYNLKTVDSIIAATAWENNMPLVSADKIFSRVIELAFIQFVI